MQPIQSRAVRGLALVSATGFAAAGLGVAQSGDAETVSLETSINAVMVSLVDHAAHEIWEAASTDRLTGRDWQTVEQHALQLVASGALIRLVGTGPQDKAWVATPPGRNSRCG